MSECAMIFLSQLSWQPMKEKIWYRQQEEGVRKNLPSVKRMAVKVTLKLTLAEALQDGWLFISQNTTIKCDTSRALHHHIIFFKGKISQIQQLFSMVEFLEFSKFFFIIRPWIPLNIFMAFDIHFLMPVLPSHKLVVKRENPQNILYQSVYKSSTARKNRIDASIHVTDFSSQGSSFAINGLISCD